MEWHHSLGKGLVAGVAMMALAACAPEPVPAEVEEFPGSCQTVFGGEICTFGTLADGVATEFGATVAMATIEGAPMEGEMVFPPVTEAVVRLPAEIVGATGYSHLGVNWEMHGHPPALFMTPHFDFHFYTMSPEEVAAIDCANLQKPATLVDGYALPDIDVPGLGMLVGLCVPTMGMHSIPSAEMEQTEPFGGSMVVGYYAGAPHFVEPMISRAKLMEGQSFELDVPAAPAGLKDGVRWPTWFEALYDEEERIYRLVFSIEK